MTDIYYAGQTYPNLKGYVRWPGLVEVTNATAQIFTGGFATASKPFFGPVTISNRFEGVEADGGSGFDVEYDIQSADSIEASYTVRLRVSFENGEIQDFDKFWRVKVKPLE